MSSDTLICDNLKASIEKAERYMLLALSSALVFAVLSFANMKSGDIVRWELLGVPLNFAPPLALILLYLVFVLSCILADNMVLHIQDLVNRLKEQRDHIEKEQRDHIQSDSIQITDIFGLPSILTVSPIARYVGIVVPPILILIGLVKSHIQGVYRLPLVVWFFAYGLSLMGFVVLLRVQKIIVPHLYDTRK